MTKTINLNTISNLFIFLIFSLVALYIFQVGSLTREKYLTKTYRNKIFSLSSTNKNLVINLSKASSLNNISHYFAKNSFVKAKNIDYIESLNTTAVARNQ